MAGSNLTKRVLFGIGIALAFAVACLVVQMTTSFSTRSRATGKFVPLMVGAIYDHLKVNSASSLSQSLCFEDVRHELEELEGKYGKVRSFEISKVEIRYFGVPALVTVNVTRERGESVEVLTAHSLDRNYSLVSRSREATALKDK